MPIDVIQQFELSVRVCAVFINLYNHHLYSPLSRGPTTNPLAGSITIVRGGGALDLFSEKSEPPSVFAKTVAYIDPVLK